MPKKGGGGAHDDEEKAEERLQAVVIATAFELGNAWAPLSLDTPPALFPLATVPLIDYTIEALVAAGVHEMFVFCGGGAAGKRISHHVKTSHWGRKLRSKHMHCIEGDKSIGDCLRECDDMRSNARIHNGDLIVVTQPLVTNHDIKKAIAQHKDSRSKDKSTIMTCTLRRLSQGHRSRAVADHTIWGYDADSFELALFDQPGAKPSKALAIDIDTIKPRREIVLCADAIDLHVYICTPQVLIEFVSNFDFNTVDQFIADMLLNYELYQHKLFVSEVAATAYGAPVKCVRSYDAVTRDVLQRWAYPLALETGWFQAPNAHQLYTCSRGSVYKEASARLARSALLGGNSVLGRGSLVGEESSISGSVVGARCVIGARCKIVDSHIWDGCVIEDGSTVVKSVLAFGVRVKSGATVSEGCMVGQGCTVGSSFTLPSYTRITRVAEVDAAAAEGGAGEPAPEAEQAESGSDDDSEDSVDEDTDDEADTTADDDDDDAEPGGEAKAAAAAAREERAAALATEEAATAASAAATNWDPAQIGEGGVGRRYHTPDGLPTWSACVDRLGVAAGMDSAMAEAIELPLVEESEEEEEVADNLWDHSEEREKRFELEMVDTIRERISEDPPTAIETMLMEMKSLRLSHNAGAPAILGAITTAVFQRARQLTVGPRATEAQIEAAEIQATPTAYAKQLQAAVKQWKPLWKAFIHEEVEQYDLLTACLDWAMEGLVFEASGDEEEEPADGAAGRGGKDNNTAARVEMASRLPRQPQLGYALQFFWQNDLLNGATILQWASDILDDDDDDAEAVAQRNSLKYCEKLLDHLREESSEEEESSEDDEDDDDSEE